MSEEWTISGIAVPNSPNRRLNPREFDSGVDSGALCFDSRSWRDSDKFARFGAKRVNARQGIRCDRQF